MNESNVWELDLDKRVQFVYVLQSKFFAKASSEFMNVSRAYLQVKAWQLSYIGDELPLSQVLRFRTEASAKGELYARN